MAFWRIRCRTHNHGDIWERLNAAKHLFGAKGERVFTGIYAHRYGTIDPETGKSITELELDEAERAHSSGALREILLYVIAPEAPWPNKYKQKGSVAKLGLRRLLAKVSRHTFTSFTTEEELLFGIIRDVYRKLAERFPPHDLRIRRSTLPPQKPLRQPMGMEFLTSTYRTHLIGRSTQMLELAGQLENNTVVLLLGDSGVGKTSLLHAGILPEAARRNWLAVYTRPLGLPYADIIHQIQATVFEAQPNFRWSLIGLLGRIRKAIGKRKLLLIIDQFEDVISARDNKETEQLISGLGALRYLDESLLTVLIAYRADVEGRLGEYWQNISGSPHGLPRVYIGGVGKEEARLAISQATRDLSIRMKLTPEEESRIEEDLLIASRGAGFSDVYPPYLQILIDHIWESTRHGEFPYGATHYQKSAGMDGIVGGYLTRLLKYARDREGHARSVLVSLVRSYGAKAQRTIDEVVADTGITRRACESTLSKLIGLRLVRHLDRFYEITHAFVARRIISEIVDSEEKELKRFKELLASKAAAYQTTARVLSSEEILLLYKHRARILPTEQELRLLLASWIQNRGPALYWLLSAEPAKLLEFVRAEESNTELAQEHRASAVLLRRKLGDRRLALRDYKVFQLYQLSSELASLIRDEPLKIPKEVLRRGLRHYREEVAGACLDAIAVQIKNGHQAWIDELRQSSSASLRRAYSELVFRENAKVTPSGKASRIRQELDLLREVSKAQSPTEVRRLLRVLRKMRPPKRILLLGKALAYVRQGRIRSLLQEAGTSSGHKAEILLSALHAPLNSIAFERLVSTYQSWNRKETGRYERPASFVKAAALADAVSRCISAKRLPSLRRAMRRIRLTSSSRTLVRSLLQHGNIKDLKFVLKRIRDSKEEIAYWNHTELVHVLGRRMQEISVRVPAFLSEIARRGEFWGYITGEEQKSWKPTDFLHIRSDSNRPLYTRIAAFGVIGTATKSDSTLLLKLSMHPYGLIAGAAARRLVYLMGNGGLEALARLAEQSVRKGEAETLANALRSAESDFYGLVTPC